MTAEQHLEQGGPPSDRLAPPSTPKAHLPPAKGLMSAPEKSRRAVHRDPHHSRPRGDDFTQRLWNSLPQDVTVTPGLEPAFRREEGPSQPTEYSGALNAVGSGHRSVAGVLLPGEAEAGQGRPWPDPVREGLRGGRATLPKPEVGRAKGRHPFTWALLPLTVGAALRSWKCSSARPPPLSPAQGVSPRGSSSGSLLRAGQASLGGFQPSEHGAFLGALCARVARRWPGSAPLRMHALSGYERAAASSPARSLTAGGGGVGALRAADDRRARLLATARHAGGGAKERARRAPSAEPESGAAAAAAPETAAAAPWLLPAAPPGGRQRRPPGRMEP